MKKDVIIIAPHADDEIIGCHSILRLGNVHSVLYDSKKAISEAKLASSYFNFKRGQIEILNNFLKKEHIFYFPDPIFELHPLHRKWGNVGEQLVRNGEEVIFYSTNMNAPYIREINNPKTKCFDLSHLYFDKKALWKYEHKYFLFEGQVKWLM